MSELRDWSPLRVFWSEGQPMVDWIFMGRRRFEEPFFEDTMQQLLYHPFHCAFRRVTPLASLGTLPSGIAPTGFIFHMSRCGSTLLCRMLAAHRQNIVLSECSPLDAVLRGGQGSDADRVQWLQWTLHALAQPRCGTEEHLFVKFDCWNIAQLPLVRRAFPGVPWIFLYREPLEVLLSHLFQPAAWTFPSHFLSTLLGLDANLPHDEYCAHAIAGICDLACRYIAEHDGRAVPYQALLDDPSPVSRENSKVPGEPFDPLASAKYDLCNERIRNLSATIIEPAYRKLELLHAA
jgi:hypothetical protein